MPKGKIIPTLHNISVGNDEIEVEDGKVLGVYFSVDLTWNKHVEYLCSKVSSVVGVITRLQSTLQK